MFLASGAPCINPCPRGLPCAQGAVEAAPLLLGHEDAALGQLRGAAAPTDAGCSGAEVLAWALEEDRWLQDSRVR